MIELNGSEWDLMLESVAFRASLEGAPKQAFYFRYKEENVKVFENANSVDEAVECLEEWKTSCENFKKQMTEVFKNLSAFEPLKFQATSDKYNQLYASLRNYLVAERLNKRISNDDFISHIGTNLPTLNMKLLVRQFRHQLEQKTSSAVAFCFPYTYDKKLTLQNLVMSRLVSSSVFSAPPLIRCVRVPYDWQEIDSSEYFLEQLACKIDLFSHRKVLEVCERASTQPIVLIFHDAHNFGRNIEFFINTFWRPIVENLNEEITSRFQKKIILFLNYKQEGRGIDHYIDFSQETSPCQLPELPSLTTLDVVEWIEDRAYKTRCQIIEQYPNCRGAQILEWENSANDSTAIDDDPFDAYQKVLEIFGGDQDLQELKEFFRVDGALIA